MDHLVQTYERLVAMSPRNRKDEIVAAHAWGAMPAGEVRFWFEVFRLEHA